jgi:hypothetical protein
MHEVPDELKFGFRDEMGKGEGEKEAKGKEREAESSSAPVPVQTTPAGPSAAAVALPAAPPSTALQPTRTVPIAPTAQPPLQLGPQIQQAQSDGVPAWIDKAIAALVAALAFMVMRKILL